jgi:hypothetical protein
MYLLNLVLHQWRHSIGLTEWETYLQGCVRHGEYGVGDCETRRTRSFVWDQSFKQFTATLVMQLVEQGKIELDDKISGLSND